MVFRSVLPPTLVEGPKGPHKDGPYSLVFYGLDDRSELILVPPRRSSIGGSFGLPHFPRFPLDRPGIFKPDCTSTTSDLFNRVISNQKKAEAFLDEYERTQRIEKKSHGADPDPATTCYRLFPGGPAVDKLPLSPDGKPADSDSYRNDLEKLEKYLTWAAEDGSSQKDAYARAQHKRKERFDLMDATHQAFVFTLEGKEMRGDHTLLRYRMTPKPAYQPTSRNTVIFTRVRGTIWIDEQSSELAKIEGSVTEDFSVALFLAKVYKGSHFMQERYEIAPGRLGTYL